MTATTIWTRYAEDKILKAFFQATPIPVPNTWYVGLMAYKGTADQGVIAGRDDVVELSGFASYARVALGAMTHSWPNAGAQVVDSNAAAVTFPEALEAWGKIAAVGLYDALANGNLWAVIPSALANQRTVRIGDRMVPPIGDIKFQGQA